MDDTKLYCPDRYAYDSGCDKQDYISYIDL